MELKIKEVLFPEVIEFNFEELKAEVQTRAAHYAAMVYTEDQTAAAKKDLAALRKLSKALNDAKIAEKKKCLKPYEDFENKIKELMGIINEPIQLIDTQLKGYEEQKKQEKREAIIAYYDNCNHPDWMRFEQIFEERWLNASVKISTIAKEITLKLEAIEKDLLTLSELPAFGFEALEAYKGTLDINAAINEGRRLAEMAQRAAEEKAKREAEANAAEEAGQIVIEESEPVPAEAPEIIEEAAEPESEKEWVSFRALLSIEDACALRDFFLMNDIEFEPIEN